MQDQPADKALSGGELIIVLIILAILSAILLPQYSKAADDGNADMPAALRDLRTRISAYRRAHDNQLPPIFYDGAVVLNGETAWKSLGGLTANPLNGRDDVCVMDNATTDFADGSEVATPGHGNRPAPAEIGWIVNAASGRIWATAANAKLMFNETSPAAASNYTK